MTAHTESSILPGGPSASRRAGGLRRLAAFLLDPPAKSKRWGFAESLVLTTYLALVAFGIAQHVPWADEVQAWLLAGDVSLPVLLRHSLHYEGTPGLWHVLLKLAHLAHLQFTAVRWIAGAVSGAGIAVLLACAPFPRLVRWLLPFSFFLAYQDAVIARSYVLFALFAFTATAMLRSPVSRPLLLALVLGGMANISLHGALVSGAMAVVAFSLWRKVPPDQITDDARLQVFGNEGQRRDYRFRSTRLHNMMAIAVLFLFWAGAAATMAPASDIDFTAGNNVQRSFAKIQQQLGFKVQEPASTATATMADLPPILPAVHVRRGLASIWNRLARILSVITYPLSTFRGLALLLVALTILQARLRSPAMTAADPGARASVLRSRPAGLIGLLPYLLMVAAFTSLYLAPRHAGMVFTGFVVTAWLTWPARFEHAGRYLALQRTTALIFVLVLVVQISWTLHALNEERTLPYSPDRAVARYLQQHGVSATGQGGSRQLAGYYYYSIGPLAYFDRNLYFNQPPHRYWLWGMQMRTYSTVEDVLARHPDFIIVGGYDPGPDSEITRDWLPNTGFEPGVVLGDGFQVAAYFRQRGYHQAQLFCGHSWIRSSYAERVCDTVLEPDAAAKTR